MGEVSFGGVEASFCLLGSPVVGVEEVSWGVVGLRGVEVNLSLWGK